MANTVNDALQGYNATPPSNTNRFATQADVTAATSGLVSSVGATAPITSSGGTTPTISTSMATDRLLGRDTAGTGVAEELTVGGGVEFTGSGGIQRSALSGDVTAAAGSATVQVDQARGLRETAGPTTLAMGAVADGEFLKRSGSTIVGGAAGLTNWTEAVNTAAPNATVPAVSFTTTNAASNVDAVIAAKGTGATLAQVPDNFSSGGNKRGSYATDLQKSRSANTRVASGSYSVIGGGYNNVVSQNYGVIAGGDSNVIATNTYAAICGGGGNTASGQYSFIGGGALNTASGTYSLVAGGLYGTTRSIYGRESFASGRFSSAGDAQRGTLVTRRQTTDATAAVILTADGAAAGSSNVNVLPNNHAYAFRVQLVARQSAGAAGTVGDTSAWEITGVIKRGANAASTALVGAITTTLLAQDAGAAAWAVAAVANTTRGSLEITVTGEASKTINWVATTWTTEVG